MSSLTVTQPSQTLSLVQAVGNAQALAAIETETAALIESLPNLSLDELSDMRNRAKTLGRCAWLIECAVDAELLRRMRLTGGRGKADVEGRGITAAVKERAEELGVDARTVFRNAQIHNTFFKAEDDAPETTVIDHSSLEEKSYYELALRSTDPKATLRKFEEARQQDPEFDTRAARKMVQTQAAPDLDSIVECALDNEQARAAWTGYLSACSTLSRNAPRVRGVITGHIEELKYELSRPAQRLQERILAIIKDIGEGVTVEDMATALGYHRDIALAFLQRLVAEDMLRIERRRSNYSVTATERGVDLYVLAG